MSYKLGSLFDGSGGFPLAGSLCGIEPMWAAEVEPYPIAVTSSRFPNMKHLGDISKVDGAEIEPVDIITFGSPCQDLSVAGKRAGLKHEDNGDDETTRSGLFMEAVRIVKEMRGATNGQYPRFAVWENVPGAFSSNNGEDFRIVLQELIKISEPNAVMPEVPKKGWAYADCFCGDGWSLAYRVFDAQYWGVPQRRRRIYLVADFRGRCAEEILFKREGLRGYFTESRTPRQAVTSDAERSLGADDTEGKCYSIDQQGGKGGANYAENVMPTLCSDSHGTPHAVAYGISSLESNAMKSSNPHSGIYEADTSRTLDGNGGNPSCNQGGIAVVENVPYTLKIRSGCDVDARGKAAGKGALIQENLSATLAVSNDQYLFQPMGVGGGECYVMATQQGGAEICKNLCPTITVAAGMSGNNQPVAAYGLDRASFNQGKNAKFDFSILDEQQPTIVAKGPGAVCLETFHCTTEDNKTQPLKARDYKDPLTVVFGEKPRYIVRRLTPTECARLQGFPDQWGHIEPKTELTDEDYRFWLEVRKTHDAINGRAVKDYDEKQMLTWYNKLWTDSAEYKMWGNGIALPCALYVLQGIKEALVNAQTERSKWLDELLRM